MNPFMKTKLLIFGQVFFFFYELYSFLCIIHPWPESCFVIKQNQHPLHLPRHYSPISAQHLKITIHKNSKKKITHCGFKCSQDDVSRSTQFACPSEKCYRLTFVTQLTSVHHQYLHADPVLNPGPKYTLKLPLHCTPNTL